MGNRAGSSPVTRTRSEERSSVPFPQFVQKPRKLYIRCVLFLSGPVSRGSDLCYESGSELARPGVPMQSIARPGFIFLGDERERERMPPFAVERCEVPHSAEPCRIDSFGLSLSHCALFRAAASAWIDPGHLRSDSVWLKKNRFCRSRVTFGFSDEFCSSC